MPRPKPYARIAITLPESVLAAADELARARDRSRSWIVAEAVRQYAATAVAHGLGDSRHAQLVRDMALTPDERVRAAEETLRLTDRTHGPPRDQILAFDRYEDFLDWKDSRRTL